MYIILLNKLRFDQISFSGRSGTRWQYGMPEWYEIVKVGNPCLRGNSGCNKCALLTSVLLFTQYKTTWLTAISSHCLTALGYLPKNHAFNSYMRQNAYCPLLPDGCHLNLLNSVTKHC